MHIKQQPVLIIRHDIHKYIASNTPWWKTKYQQDPLVSKHSNRPKPFICSKYWSLWNKFPLKIHDLKLFHVAYYQKSYEILKFKVLCQEIRYITHILLIFRIRWQHTYFLGRKLDRRKGREGEARMKKGRKHGKVKTAELHNT